MYQNQLAYRQASVEGATQVGLLTIVYEALAADLLKAGEASQGRDVQERCQASNHALLLLGHLETWLGYLDEPQLTQSLGEFYGFLRARIVTLQRDGRREDFQELSSLVFDVRSTWQEKSQQTIQARAITAATAGRDADLEEQARERTNWFA